MKHFSWHGIDRSGSIKKGRGEFVSKEALQINLQSLGVVLIYCTESDNDSFDQIIKNSFFNDLLSKLNFRFFRSQNVTESDLADFFYSLSFLIDSGVSLISSLEILQKQLHSLALLDLVKNILLYVRAGESFSDSFEKAFKNKNSLFIPLIKSGELSGKLGLVLNKLALYEKNKIEFSKKISRSAIMPLITLIGAVGLIFSMFVFVIPRFELFFENYTQELPATTKIILNLSYFFRTHLVLISLVILTFLIFIKFISKSHKLSEIKYKFIFHTKFFGELLLLGDQVQFFETFGLLLDSGLPIRNSIIYASLGVKNIRMRKCLEQISNLVDSGNSISDAIKYFPKYFPSYISEFLATGEHTGKLSLIVERIYLQFKNDLDQKMQLLSTLFAPVLILIVGIFVVMILLSVYIPIFSFAHFV